MTDCRGLQPSLIVLDMVGREKKKEERKGDVRSLSGLRRYSSKEPAATRKDQELPTGTTIWREVQALQAVVMLPANTTICPGMTLRRKRQGGEAEGCDGLLALLGLL